MLSMEDQLIPQTLSQLYKNHKIDKYDQTCKQYWDNKLHYNNEIQSQLYYTNSLPYFVPVNECILPYQHEDNFQNFNEYRVKHKKENTEETIYDHLTSDNKDVGHQSSLMQINHFGSIQSKPSNLSNIASNVYQKNVYSHIKGSSIENSDSETSRDSPSPKKNYFKVLVGPDSHQVKDWFITPTNILELDYEPENSDIIAVYLGCDSSMGLNDPEIFLCAKSPKFNSISNQIHLSNLKIARGMIQGPTKGFKFCLIYILLSYGKEVWRVKSEPFHLWSSGGFPSNLNLYEKQQEHLKSLSLGNSFNDDRESPRRKRTKAYD